MTIDKFDWTYNFKYYLSYDCIMIIFLPIQYLFRIDIFAIYIMLINIDVASIWLIINELDDRSEFEQYEDQIIE